MEGSPKSRLVVGWGPALKSRAQDYRVSSLPPDRSSSSPSDSWSIWPDWRNDSFGLAAQTGAILRVRFDRAAASRHLTRAPCRLSDGDSVWRGL